MSGGNVEHGLGFRHVEAILRWRAEVRDWLGTPVCRSNFHPPLLSCVSRVSTCAQVFMLPLLGLANGCVG